MYILIFKMISLIITILDVKNNYIEFLCLVFFYFKIYFLHFSKYSSNSCVRFPIFLKNEEESLAIKAILSYMHFMSVVVISVIFFSLNYFREF
jgi:hypothetical protein